MLYLLNLRKHSNQVELDQFFKTIHNKAEASQHITKSAFFQARKQLSHTAFIDLNHPLMDGIYQNNLHYKTWNGFRLCAVDGTTLRLPDEPDITNHFGLQKGKPNQDACSMGMASVFYDVLNHLVIDSSINPNTTSERKCVAEHLAYAGKNDLVIYDRGYNAFWLYALHLKHNHAFCMRAKVHQNLAIKAFANSGKQDAVVTFAANKTSVRTCHDRGLPSTPITLRLVRVELPNEVEVLITNLMDAHHHPAGGFKSLYHQRWGIEESYKRLKQWTEIENFSGKSALSVQQDFYAKIVAVNLTALMAMAAQQTVVQDTAHRRIKYQINFAQALSKMKHRMIQIILHAHGDALSLIKQTIRYLSETIEAVRDGRSTPRRAKNNKQGRHFAAYKSAL